MSAGIIIHFWRFSLWIFFQISSWVSYLNFLLFLNTHVSSLKYSAGPAQTSSTTLIFCHKITVSKMKLLIVRSTIAIQNMLWIAIYIYSKYASQFWNKFDIISCIDPLISMAAREQIMILLNACTETQWQNETLFQTKSQIFWHFTCIK